MKARIYILIASFLFTASCSNNNNKNEITASGTIESVNVTVSSKVAGQIKKLNFKEGDRVKTGDLLVELDHDMLDIQLRQAEAGVDLAYAQLKLLRSGARKEDVRQTEELVKQAKTNLDLAKQDRDRAIQLYNENATTKQLYDAAVARYDVALAQYNSARENLQKVKSIIRPEEIESAQANLKRAISSVDLIKESIEESKIYSPVDGFVSKKFVEVGENISPATSLLRISNLETVDLVIYIPETELGKVKLGQDAEVKIDAFKDKVYTGKIIFISPEAEFTPKNIQTPDERTKLVFAVKIQIPNPQFELKPGLPADATIKF
ncbi:MAG TPA: efflux RND transporter periplasmic adaptor subunit [Ignavibacteria bacterium]